MRSIPYTSAEELTRRGRVLVGAMIALLGLGIVMVYSATFVEQLRISGSGAMLGPLFGHVLKVGMALMVFLLALRVTPGVLFAWAARIWVVAVVLLIAVLVVGTERNGSTRWFDIAGLSLQPSELARVATIIMIGAWTAGARDRVIELRHGVLIPFAFAAIPAGLVFIEPDLGSSIFLLFMGVLVMWVGGARSRHLLAVFLPAVAVASLYGWTHFGHVPGRLASFIHPVANSQVGQGLTAIGNGGLTGQGLGSGLGQWGLVPEAESDWVLSVVGEELGLLGTGMVVVLYALILWHGVHILLGLRSRFSLVVGAGLLMQVLVQAVLNIAVVTALAPPKGLPLPFVSAGGTSLMVLCASVGLLLGLARRPEDDPVIEARLATSLTHRGEPGA